ncbi:MAG: serine/threonine-protein kinase, partial [Gemmatimonadota bacterium]
MRSPPWWPSGSVRNGRSWIIPPGSDGGGSISPRRLHERAREALRDRYRIDEEIGRGGTAIVFRGEDLRHGREVAIKVLHPEVSAVLGRERFLREIEIAARLAHPHILPLYDSGDADGLLYHVSPLLEGETLRDRLQRERMLPVEEALRIGAQVLDGLGYAHRNGIVHRDIKPANILLSGEHAL